MNRLIYKIIAIVALLLATSECQTSEGWDDMPRAVAEFVTKYFPEQAVESCGQSGDVYHVQIRDGAGLTFNTDYQWVSVNGFGSALPQMFLFDQLPPTLYERLQVLDELGGVYSVSRSATYYYVTLQDSSLSYSIADGVITRS